MRKKIQDDMRQTEETFLHSRNISSATDCTGIVPFEVEDEEESEAYQELSAGFSPKPQKEE